MWGEKKGKVMGGEHFGGFVTLFLLLILQSCHGFCRTQFIFLDIEYIQHAIISHDKENVVSDVWTPSALRTNLLGKL